MNRELFNSDKDIKKKREAVKAAKKANPRKVELVCLKNRYGVSSYSCGFNYYAAYDLFEPDMQYTDQDEAESKPTRRI
jgi:replicative DNA helicase